MAFYALATIPLVRRCKVDMKCESWFADDSAAAGGAHRRRLRQRWDNLVNFGPSHGCFVNGQKIPLEGVCDFGAPYFSPFLDQ